MAYPIIPANRVECNSLNQVMVADIVAAINANNTAVGEVIIENGTVSAGAQSSINALIAEMAALQQTVATQVALMQIPVGTIVAYSGNVANIPTGWRICDGGGGTPNLINKFIFGTKTQAEIRSTGGSANAEVVSHTHSQQAHTHTGSAVEAGEHNHDIKTFKQHVLSAGNPSDYAVTGSYTSAGYPYTENAGNHSHGISIDAAGGHINATGVNGTNKNLPPYMKFAYIIKL